jgi:hypothetical protein
VTGIGQEAKGGRGGLMHAALLRMECHGGEKGATVDCISFYNRQRRGIGGGSGMLHAT